MLYKSLWVDTLIISKNLLYLKTQTRRVVMRCDPESSKVNRRLFSQAFFLLMNTVNQKLGQSLEHQGITATEEKILFNL